MLTDSAVLALVVAAVEMLKRWKWATWIDGDTAPVFAAMIGGVFNLINSPSLTAPDLLVKFKEGMVLGLVATGVYAGAKGVIKKTSPTSSSSSPPSA